MTTHHNRPGGRILEVTLALGLVLLSAWALLGAVVIPFVIYYWVVSFVPRIFVIVVLGLMIGFKHHTRRFVLEAMRSVWSGLAMMWKPFLRYYQYEAHTLRPIKDEIAAMPCTGRDMKEG